MPEILIELTEGNYNYLFPVQDDCYFIVDGYLSFNFSYNINIIYADLKTKTVKWEATIDTVDKFYKPVFLPYEKSLIFIDQKRIEHYDFIPFETEDIRLTKIDTNGTIVFDKLIHPLLDIENYNYGYDYFIFDATISSNGELIVSGHDGNSWWDFPRIVIIGFDTNGNPKWFNGYKGLAEATSFNYSFGQAIDNANGGVCLLVDPVDSNPWVYNIDAKGDTIWTDVIAPEKNDDYSFYYTDIISRDKNDILIAGLKSNYDLDISHSIIIKYNKHYLNSQKSVYEHPTFLRFRRLHKIVDGFITWGVNPDFEQYLPYLIKFDTALNCAPKANFNATPILNTYGVAFNAISSGGDISYLWSFGDGFGSILPNPTHQYAAESTYAVSMVAMNLCGADTFTTQIYVDFTNTQQFPDNNLSNNDGFMVYPNPVTGGQQIYLQYPVNIITYTNTNIKFTLYNILGQQIATHSINPTNNNPIALPLPALPNGVYWYRITTANTTENQLQTGSVVVW